ncbi:hypothetical protein [Anaerotruncus rubiinfantis]|uniref:hypothetical protein n=1 Tax=Anaerotruncus rubiinfantis TaxID=1720200 RepID=UPI00189717DE|nr:hypothetical protein [Anaerotruncus rubiinfantis]
MNDLQKRAIKFFRSLAAGAPLSNVTWGKSEREVRDIYLLAALAIENAEKAEVKYIFRLNAMLKADDKAKIRQEIKRQLEEGVLLLDNYVSFEEREIEICGHKVTVELVERAGSEVAE